MQFWYKKGLLNYLLVPISYIWQIITYLRLKKSGSIVQPLIICVGNITVGGAGKTPFILYLAKELQKIGLKVAILSRGYGGKVNNKTLLVNPNIHQVDLIGDEACLLSKASTLVISKNRLLGAKFLAKKKYQVILMDDGFQNTQLEKDINILVFNTLNPFGNGLLIPAGPLRESFNSAQKRANLVIAIGNQENLELTNKIAISGLKYIYAKITPKLFEIDIKKSYLAFCSIGYPDKFYNTLRNNNFDIKLTKSFKDHYFYTDKDIKGLINIANKLNLKLITTSKDYVKIKPKYYSYIDKLEIDITLNSEDTNFLINFLMKKLQSKRKFSES